MLPDLRTMDNEDLCTPELQGLYWSVLGAIAYALTTRLDIAVFVAQLQRRNHNPQIIHCKRLNAVVRWAQRTPKKITYLNLDDQNQHIRIYADAAFKKENDDGHSMCGMLYIRCPGKSYGNMHPMKCHVLDYVSRGQRKVVRSTFTAELLVLCDAVDKGIQPVSYTHLTLPTKRIV